MGSRPARAPIAERGAVDVALWWGGHSGPHAAAVEERVPGEAPPANFEAELLAEEVVRVQVDDLEQQILEDEPPHADRVEHMRRWQSPP